MAATASRTSGPHGPWANTFPEKLEEVAHSKEFVYRFLLCASAMILEKRRLLPEACFKTRIIEKLQIPNYNLENGQAKRLKAKIEGLKAAIEKCYLQEFAIVMYKKPDEEDVIEAFSFKFYYEDDESVRLTLNSGLETQDSQKRLLEFKFESLDKAKEQFVKIMKTLNRFITKALDDLPDGVDGSFRIAYTATAPEDYTPEGFVSSEEFYKISEKAETHEVGMIGGGFHKLQILGASLLRKANIADFNRTVASLDESFMIQNIQTQQSVHQKPKAPKKTFNKIRYGVTEGVKKKTGK